MKDVEMDKTSPLELAPHLVHIFYSTPCKTDPVDPL